MSSINKNTGYLLEEQINKELHSSDLYLQMAFWFENQDWMGSAHWMYKQSNEERKHALSIARHLLDREWMVKIDSSPCHKINWNDPLDVWTKALQHEIHITKSIQAIMQVANDDNDYQSQQLCYKFLQEQIEEEDTIRKIISKIKAMKGNYGFYIEYDKTLGDR
jgi:ferritin